ncbi:hypothetical protein MNBD_GAMMA05-577 [hydrothermal vent metagenome]|uniref:Ice-binding protein C-terminal domain-containing protein n=1 Tax=hydrothermal vent metagenome TaxID=652676 RepID=A0A3B0XA36_9ZZZZ
MKWFKSSLLVLGMTVSMASSAAIITMSGDDIDFTFDDSTLFGSGTVVGNSLFFMPTNFKAESLNGAGVVTANQTLIVDVVVTTAGYDITSLGMFEQGDYITNGVDASVAAAGRLGVTSTTTVCGFIACNDANIFNVAGLGDTGGVLTDWSGGTSVDLVDTAGWGSDTSLQISFQNDLSANTLNDGEQAFIEKKFGAIGLVVNPVPVPAALWLFGSGLLGLVAVARRKQS